MKIRVGVIGLSDGNGHPYSWSAIINGYSPADMAQCGFPVIPKYLAEQKWPDSRIPDALVTHIWTQSPELSALVARASLIPNVAAVPEAMLGEIDALLLARDDAENHFNFAKSFIEAGIPVYIDKPIALSLEALDRLYSCQQYEGQIFTCSALRYAHEFAIDDLLRQKIGTIRHIEAITPKSWEKYAVHIIDPVLRILGPKTIANISSTAFADTGRAVQVRFTDQTTAGFTAMGDNLVSPVAIRIHGEKGWHDMVFSDSFYAFRCALQDFLDGIRTKSCKSPLALNQKIVSIIEAGMAI